MSKRSYRRLLFSSMAVLVCGVSWLTMLQACDTPVYRYAMYRWNPAPYEIYYFHNKPLSDETEAFHEHIRQVAKLHQDQPVLNATLIPVDLSKDPQLKQILPDIKQLWTKHQKQLSPGYLVTNPRGSVVVIGTLAEKQLKAMTDSPRRRQLLTQLGQGKATVLILLSGKDASATKVAEKEVRSLVEAVNSGKVDLYRVPGAAATDEGKPADTPAKPAHTIGLLTLDRNDPAETWLIHSLLAIEDDLKDLPEPMVFAVYGRARALPPYIGKGINRDNLLQCIEFVTGACSCTVKEQNPGIDLLVQSNWEAMAAKVADLFGSEEGNETQFGGDEFFPELIIGAGSKTTDTTVVTPDLRIYCADELRHPLGEIVRQYEQQHNVSIAVNYGTSSELLTMIEISKTGDVYVAGNSSYFTDAEKKGLSEASIPLARRRPVIAVVKGNSSISGIKDLLDPQVKLAIGDPEEGLIGRFTKQLLTASGHWQELSEHVTDHGLMEASVDDISDAIKQGRVTAGIIWDTVARRDPDLKLVPCPELEAGETSIEIALLSCSTAAPAARQFIQYVASPKEGLTVFQQQGFRLAADTKVQKRLPREEDDSQSPLTETTAQGSDDSPPAASGTTDQLANVISRKVKPESDKPVVSQTYSMLILGIGILVGLVVLFGITLFVLRPR